VVLKDETKMNIALCNTKGVPMKKVTLEESILEGFKNRKTEDTFITIAKLN
jgi:hypothetical protein